MSMHRRALLTSRAHDAFSHAHDLADRLGHDELTSTHIALGVLREGRNPAVGALFNLGVPLEDFARELEAHLPPSGTARTPIAERSWTFDDEQIIERARLEARELGTEFFACEHLLLALLRDRRSTPAQLLARHGVRFDDVRAEIKRIYTARPE